MINHGLSTGALFLLIGFMYERYHTRDMREIGGLAGKMPVWSFFMVFFVMASVGLPGLNGFVSEFLCTMGAFQLHPLSIPPRASRPGRRHLGPLGPWFAVVAGTGVIVAAIYLLYMTSKIVWGTLREPAHHHDDEEHSCPPTSRAARSPASAPLAALCLFFGLYPKPAHRRSRGTDQPAGRVHRGRRQGNPHRAHTLAAGSRTTTTTTPPTTT
jgi:NADH-quinone oxidoreductase subunit M